MPTPNKSSSSVNQPAARISLHLMPVLTSEEMVHAVSWLVVQWTPVHDVVEPTCSPHQLSRVEAAFAHHMSRARSADVCGMNSIAPEALQPTHVLMMSLLESVCVGVWVSEGGTWSSTVDDGVRSLKLRVPPEAANVLPVDILCVYELLRDVLPNYLTRHRNVFSFIAPHARHCINVIID